MSATLPRPSALATAAAASYAANCALGIAVATRVINTSRAHWVHHALYITTTALTVAAIGSSARSRPHAAVVMAPALIPFAAIPFAGTHTRRHPTIALAAAPFVLAGLITARRR